MHAELARAADPGEGRSAALETGVGGTMVVAMGTPATLNR
jgi:hypothetical protein